MKAPRKLSFSPLSYAKRHGTAVDNKKGPKDNRKTYRAIYLLPHAFKVFSMCLLHRIAPCIDPLPPDSQAGFRAARGCRDNTCILAWTVDWLLKQGRRAVKTYIDFKAAFDSDSHTFLLPSLRSYGCPEKYVRLFALMYDTARVTVRIQLRCRARVHSQMIQVARGVLKGDILSPLLFLIALDCIFSRHNQKSSGVLIMNMPRLNKLDFADDVALIDEKAADPKGYLE